MVFSTRAGKHHCGLSLIRGGGFPNGCRKDRVGQKELVAPIDSLSRQHVSGKAKQTSTAAEHMLII
jgi:hypothetical protein